MSIPSFGKDFLFVLKCQEQYKKNPYQFYFIGKGKDETSYIVYLEHRIAQISPDDKISFNGGENKSLKLVKQSNDFFEYSYRQPSTPKDKEYSNIFVLNRSSLRLTEGYEKDNSFMGGYECHRESDETQSYRDGMKLKLKNDTGGNNKI